VHTMCNRVVEYLQAVVEYMGAKLMPVVEVEV
jgi:hypothetical protein